MYYTQYNLVKLLFLANVMPFFKKTVELHMTVEELIRAPVKYFVRCNTEISISN